MRGDIRTDKELSTFLAGGKLQPFLFRPSTFFQKFPGSFYAL